QLDGHGCRQNRFAVHSVVIQVQVLAGIELHLNLNAETCSEDRRSDLEQRKDRTFQGRRVNSELACRGLGRAPWATSEDDLGISGKPGRQLVKESPATGVWRDQLNPLLEKLLAKSGTNHVASVPRSPIDSEHTARPARIEMRR